MSNQEGLAAPCKAGKRPSEVSLERIVSDFFKVNEEFDFKKIFWSMLYYTFSHHEVDCWEHGDRQEMMYAYREVLDFLDELQDYCAKQNLVTEEIDG